MKPSSNNGGPTVLRDQWRANVARFRQASLGHSLWQIANTFIPLIITWVLMYLSLNVSYLLTLALTPLAAGCHVRVFIILHDCGHGSFFKARWANDVLGSICGLLCLTPYFYWRHSHALHHAASGDLGRRVDGQVMPMTIQNYVKTNGSLLTLTVKEYQELSPLKQLIYRIYRHPLILFVFIPSFLFVVLHRFGSAKVGRRERISVLGTNLAIVVAALVLITQIGVGPFLLVEGPIVVLTTTIAVWLFYVQHQFEQTYWESQTDWDYVSASLQGSSYYKLPRLFQWFTGNIGFHHIHHLSPRIPNYYLERCHAASPLFQQTPAITLWSGMRSIYSNLWDEEQQKMVRFRYLRANRHRS